MLQGGFSKPKFIRLDKLSRIGISISGSKAIKIVCKVIEKTKARAYVFKTSLVRKYKSQKEEANETGFGGDVQTQSKRIGTKQARHSDHQAWTTANNGSIINKNHGSSLTYGSIPYEQAGFCNWKSFYTSEDWYELKQFIFGFSPQSQDQFYIQFENQFKHEDWWNEKLGKHISSVAESVHAIIFQWTFDKIDFPKRWNLSTHEPNVEFPMFDNLVGVESHQIKLYNDCISIPMRQTLGYMNGRLYVISSKYV